MAAMTASPSAKSVAPASRSHTLGVSAEGVLFPLASDLLLRLRTAYQRDGRLAAAAALRQQNAALTMSDALWTIDRALGLRKPTAIY